MPISFEAPQPLDPSISAGYGATQTEIQQYPQIVSAASAAAQHQIALLNALGGGGGGGGGGSAGASALAQNMAERYAAANQIESQNAGLTQQAAGADQQAALQGQATQQKAALYQAQQDVDFTQAQKLQMQELQNDQSAIMQQTSSGQLTPAEGSHMLSQVQMPLSALKKIQAASQIKAQNLQNQQLQSQIQQQDHLQAMGTTKQVEEAALVAKNGPRFTFQDDDGNSYYVDPATKKVQQIKTQKETTGADQQKKTDAVFTQEAKLRAEWWKQAHDIRKDVATEAEQKEGTGAEAKWANPGLRDPDNFRKEIENRMKYWGLAPTMDEHVRQHLPAYARSIGADMNAHPATAAPQPQPQTPRQAQQEFPSFKDGQPTTEPQKEAMKGLQWSRQLISRSDLPEAAKKMYDEQVNHAEYYFKKYGSADLMKMQDAPAYAHYNAILQSLDQIVGNLSKPQATPPVLRTPSRPESWMWRRQAGEY